MDSGLEKVDFRTMSWSYRGEGNANIVIALEDLRVIRLSKSHKDNHDKNNKVKLQVPNPDAEAHVQHHHTKLLREIKNTNIIMMPLVGPGLLSPVRIVEIDEDQITYLNEKLQNQRPSHRLHKHLMFKHATTHTDFARLHPNGSNLVDYCIEIKPKKGWLDKSSVLATASGLCNFCLHQFLKLSQKKIQHRSNYCPLDLFSGVPSRMIYSLMSLLENPQNNLRIFKNGSLVYGDGFLDKLDDVLDGLFPEEDSQEGRPVRPTLPGSRSLGRFLYVFAAALMKPLNQDDPKTFPESTNSYKIFEKELHELLLHSILMSLENTPNIRSCTSVKEETFVGYNQASSDPVTSNVLSTLLSVQLLNQEPPPSVLEVYKKICPVHSVVSSNDFPECLSQTSKCPDESCFANEVYLDECKETLEELLTPDEVARLQNFLLSATANDCSLMITISSMGKMKSSEIKNLHQDHKSDTDNKSYENSIFYLQDLYNNNYLYKVKIGLADMDVKPITCVPKQCLRDISMLRSFITK